MLIEKAIEDVTENLDPEVADTPVLDSEGGPFGVVPDDGLGDS